MPFQKALKLPATMPERIVSDAPPSREAVTISWTCLECELVKTLVNSGISTAASVPQLMIVASCHHRFWQRRVAPPATVRSPISSQLMTNDVDDAQDRGDPDQARQRLLEVEFLQALVLASRRSPG